MGGDPTHTFLLEVGCEELPAGFLAKALADWPTLLADALTRHAIPFDPAQLRVEGTPRRLVCWINGLPSLLPDRTEDTKGPPVRIAYDANGQPTPATLGFLKKNSATLDQVEQATIGEETYLVLRKVVAGQAVRDVIGAVAMEAFGQLAGPRFMRWGDQSVTFSRPVQWLLAMWDDGPCPATYDLGNGDILTAGQTTRGHRIMATQPVITINSVASYEQQLAESGAVVVSVTKRQALIEQQLQTAAQQLNARPILALELLEHVTHLVEAPTVVVGSFDAKFLEIPACVLITVMKAHQKYFPVQNEDGTLAPHFLCVSNGRPEASATIAKGNERVLKARLEDAAFFVHEDLKVPLESRLEALKGVTFQKGLGTLYDKTLRLEALCKDSKFYTGFNLSDQKLADLGSAARLSKTDLVTSMVFELTELQGEVGREYAKKSPNNQPDTVAQALFEQYLPRFAGDELPKTKVGMALNLADKLDTLVAIFSQKDAKLPTGSKDPLGLRRLMNGILGIILVGNYGFLDNLFQCTFDLLEGKGITQRTKLETWELIQEFATQRLIAEWRAEGYRHDIVQAAVDSTPYPPQHLPWVTRRLENLHELWRDAPQWLLAQCEGAHRVDRILGPNLINPVEWYTALNQVQANLFTESERPLLALLYELRSNRIYVDSQIHQSECRLNNLITSESLNKLPNVVSQYFDSVLVNDPDDHIRTNRYHLLYALHGFYCSVLGRLSRLDTTALQQQTVSRAESETAAVA